MKTAKLFLAGMISLSAVYAQTAAAAEQHKEAKSAVINTANTDATTETIGVNGMVCSFCAQGISKKFKEQPEVSNVEVSLEKKFVKLTYKDGQKLSHDKIGTLLKEAGYEVSFAQK